MNLETLFSQMIQELLERDFNKVAPPGALLSLDFLVHSDNVYGLEGPVGIYTSYIQEKERLLSHEIDKKLSANIRIVEEQFTKVQGTIKVPNIIICTNLDEELLISFKESNSLNKNIHLWGTEKIKRLLSKYKDILRKYNEIFFVGRLKEELGFLTRNPDRRNEQIKYNNTKNVRYLKDSFVNGQLALFLGAGVSISAGIPGWEELVSKVYLKSLRIKGIPLGDLENNQDLYWNLSEGINSTNLLIKTKYSKYLLGDEFINLIKEVLYAESTTSSSLIDSIVGLCESKEGKLRGVVTYNFDDLLERNLKEKNILFCSAWNAMPIVDRKVLPLYHVHGYIPIDKQIDSQIVFSEDDYHKQYEDIYSWSNIIQINFFRDNNCLFVGTSLLDPNIRRLLDIAKKTSTNTRHYVIQKRIYSQEHIKKIMANIKDINSTIADISGETHFIKRKYQHIDSDEETLRNIMLTEELLIEKDYESLGVKVIWVDSFDEIVTIMKLIDK
ncbi:SIR2 family protein [Bacillus cereus]